MLIEWLIRFGPITAFFLVFKASGGNFFAATAVLMAFVVVASAAGWVRSHTFPWFSLWSATFVIVFGGATLYYSDPHWLIVKDTIYDGIFGLTLLFGLAFRKNLLEAFFLPLFAISEHAWHVLAVRFALFFLISAFLNEIFRNFFSIDAWVYYKIMSTIALIVFVLFQVRLTGKERLASESNRLGMRLNNFPRKDD